MLSKQEIQSRIGVIRASKRNQRNGVAASNLALHDIYRHFVCVPKESSSPRTGAAVTITLPGIVECPSFGALCNALGFKSEAAVRRSIKETLIVRLFVEVLFAGEPEKGAVASAVALSSYERFITLIGVYFTYHQDWMEWTWDALKAWFSAPPRAHLRHTMVAVFDSARANAGRGHPMQRDFKAAWETQGRAHALAFCPLLIPTPAAPVTDDRRSGEDLGSPALPAGKRPRPSSLDTRTAAAKKPKLDDSTGDRLCGLADAAGYERGPTASGGDDDDPLDTRLSGVSSVDSVHLASETDDASHAGRTAVADNACHQRFERKQEGDQRHSNNNYSTSGLSDLVARYRLCRGRRAQEGLPDVENEMTNMIDEMAMYVRRSMDETSTPKHFATRVLVTISLAGDVNLVWRVLSRVDSFDHTPK